MNPAGFAVFALVAIGGGIGAAARFWLSSHITTTSTPHLTGGDLRLIRKLPWGTIAVNILGSFIIGVIAGLALTLGATAFEPWRIALASGLCGGFTTFSTTTVESVALARRSELKAAIANSLGTLVTCVAATALGVVVVTS